MIACVARSLRVVALVLLAFGCDEAPPTATEPTPPTATAQVRADGRCEHGLVPTLCPRCTPALEAVYRRSGNWCEEHGFPESLCPICHPDAELPDLAAPRAHDWCVEHGLPESQCTRCNPSLVAGFRAAGDFCEAHGFPESACPICHPQTPPAGAEEAAIEARLVQIASEELVAAAGIATEPAGSAAIAPELVCAARIAFDADRMADVRALVPGVVRRVRVELGDVVEPGAPLFELESVRVGEVQAALAGERARLRSVTTTLERRRALHGDELLSSRELEATEREAATAEADVRASEALLRLADATGRAGHQVLRAPLAGTVVRRPAVVGSLATEDVSLATIADTRAMWVLCEVPEARAHELALGQAVSVSVVGRDTALEGELTWIAAEVDPRTRTVTAQAVVPNLDGALRAHQFARAVVRTGPARGGASVPRGAVQRVDDHEVVFVRLAPRVFEPRVVRRFGDGPVVVVEGRVAPGDPVVTTGAVLLRTEILPGSIGAGCCEVE